MEIHFILWPFYFESYMESKTVYEVIFSTVIIIRHYISFKVLWRHQVVECFDC